MKFLFVEANMAKAKKKGTSKAKNKKVKAKTKAKSAKTLKAKPKVKTRKVVKPKAAALTGLKVGDKVPNLELPATGAKTVRLADLGKRVVLYFYPKDMTPGCTIQGHEFTALKNEFDASNAVILGVSRDSVQSHEKFKQKENYTIDLLADEQSQLCNAFGVIKDKNMYGKMVKGIERSTFVIDETGRVIKEWRGVKAEGHAAQVLEYLKTT
jgi:thioredoxin-dependent peroxiredoxin